MSKTNEQHQLETAFRAATRLLQAPFQPGVEVPRLPKPDSLNGLQLRRRVEELNRDITYLQGVVEGRIQPLFKIDKTSMSEQNENRALVKKGLKILKDHRKTCVRRLRWLKLQQPKAAAILKKAHKLQQETVELLDGLKREAEETYRKIEAMEAETGRLAAEYQRINLDPVRPFPASDHRWRVERLRVFVKHLRP